MPLLPGLALWALTTGHAEAQPSDGAAPPPAPRAPRNHLGASVMGVAGFLRHNVGSFEVFYERILGRRHGLRLAGDFLHVHHNSDAVQSHQWTFGGTLSYRLYHRDGAGLFGGLKAGYRRGTGHFGPPHPEPGHVHLQSEQVLVLPQVGYRFLLPRAPLSIVAALGLGYAFRRVSVQEGAGEAAQLALRTTQDNLGTTPLALDLELSLAYSF